MAIKWQEILKYGGGTISVVTLVVLILNLSGMSFEEPPDIECETDCYSEILVKSTYWEICAEHSGDKDIIYKKRTRSRRLWINLDKIDNVITTQPNVFTELLVPTYGGKYRQIKDGDCIIKRFTKANPRPSKLIIHGIKEPAQTIKWSFDLDDPLIEDINIDPIWRGNRGRGLDLIQSEGKVIYTDLDYPINLDISLQLRIANQWINATDNLWFKDKKFGWNKIFAVPLATKNITIPARYIVESDKELSIKGNNIITKTRLKSSTCGSVRCTQERYETVIFSDVCTNLYTNISDSSTLYFSPNCSFTIAKDNKIQLDFFVNYDSGNRLIDIDPTIQINDVSVANAILTNITAENNFTHLTIGDVNNDFINDSNLAFYMSFDTNTTNVTAYDYSPNSQDGTISANVYWNNSGIFGGAYIFPRIAPTFIDLGNINTSIPDVTACAWIRWDNPGSGGEHTVLSNFGTGGILLRLEPSNNQAELFLEGVSGSTDVSPTDLTISDSDLHHVCLKYISGTGLFYYQDGVESSQTGANVGDIAESNNNFRIGNDPVGGGRDFFNGTIDEVFMVNISLTAAQITSIFNNQSSRFFPRGEQIFPDTNVSEDASENRINITLNGTTNTHFDSVINISIGDQSGDDYSYGTEVNFTNNEANDITISTPNNISLKFIFYAGNRSLNTDFNSYISPNLVNDIVIDSFTAADNTPVIVNALANGTNNFTFGEFIKINATVTDADDNLNNVTIQYLPPGLTAFNITAPLRSGDEFFNDTVNLSITGQWEFKFFANDTTGLNATSVTVQDLGGEILINVSTANVVTVFDCGTLDQKNKIYILFQDVSTTGTCFTIAANNITLNLNSHSATGDADSANDFGVSINGFNDTLVKNGSIVDFGRGIRSNIANNGTFTDLDITASGDFGLASIVYGMSIALGADNNVSLNNISRLENTNSISDFYGVRILASTGRTYIDSNELINISAGTEYGGIRLRQSNDTVIRDNTILESLYGIITVVSSNNTLIEDNIIETHGRYGITLEQASSNVKIFRNTIQFLGRSGIHISSGSFNQIENVTINDSLEDGIFLVLAGADHNNFTNVTISNTNENYHDINFTTEGIDGTYLIDMPHIGNYSFAGTGGTVHFLDTAFGEIFFFEAINGSGFNLTNDVRLDNNNSATVDVDSNSELNRAANITLFGFPGASLSDPELKRDGATCAASICTNFTSLSVENVKFNVTSWTNYSIGESPLDTCSYTSGNYAPLCSDNCTIVTNIKIDTGFNITIKGNGSFTCIGCNITGYSVFSNLGDTDTDCNVLSRGNGSILPFA